MATTTTNNAWAIPQSTDLVTNGATAMATLGQAIDTSVGTGLLAWTAYTPTWTNLTIGNATQTWAYAKIGKVVHVRGKLVWGSTTSATASQTTFSLPVTAQSAYSSGHIIGTTYIGDVSASQPYFSFVYWLSTTTAGLVAVNASGTFAGPTSVSGTVPMTFAVSDQVYVSMAYEAA